MIERLKGWLTGLLLLVTFFLYARTKGQEADKAKQDAATAKADADTGRKVDAAVGAVQAKHREEQKESNQRLKAGKRDHLDNDWGGT